MINAPTSKITYKRTRKTYHESRITNKMINLLDYFLNSFWDKTGCPCRKKESSRSRTHNFEGSL